MSDTETTTQPVEPAEGATEQPASTAEDNLGDAGKRALTAERDARKAAERELSEARARLKEIEDANLSEIQKAQRDAEEARSQLAILQLESTRSRVALEKGVPSDLIEFITGDTAEEMAAKADVLVARLSPASTTPKPDRTQGTSSPAQKATTADQFAEFFAANIDT